VAAAAVGLAAGAGLAAMNKATKNAARSAHQTMTINDLNKEN
jgi:hypothetical protein